MVFMRWAVMAGKEMRLGEKLGEDMWNIYHHM